MGQRKCNHEWIGARYSLFRLIWIRVSRHQMFYDVLNGIISINKKSFLLFGPFGKIIVLSFELIENLFGRFQMTGRYECFNALPKRRKSSWWVVSDPSIY